MVKLEVVKGRVFKADVRLLGGTGQHYSSVSFLRNLLLGIESLGTSTSTFDLVIIPST